MVLANEEGENSYIKWVDYNVPLEVMEDYERKYNRSYYRKKLENL